MVAALVPWNFPITLASRKKISTALSAGCSVIVNPMFLLDLAMELVDVCKRNGLPPGVVNLLSGDPAYISDQLLSSNIVKKSFKLLDLQG